MNIQKVTYLKIILYFIYILRENLSEKDYIIFLPSPVI